MAAPLLPEKPCAVELEPGPGDDRADDRWISDLPDALGCLSLSSDQDTRRHFDELGQMGCDREHEIDPCRERPTWHGDCGV